MMKIAKKISVLLILVVIALASMAMITPRATNVERHSEQIKQVDEEIETVLKLTGGAAGASAVISLLPDDQCTPIANELAELAKYFLVVLSALYLEKYLLTITGYVSFSFLIPIACACFGIGYLAKKGTLRAVAYKLVICAFSVYMLVPASLKISGLVYDNYDNSIQSTIDEADRISLTEADEDASLAEKLASWLQNAAVTVTEYVTGLLSNFIDALAVMIVTSCLIPILVVICFGWLMKLLFGVEVPMEKMPRPFAKRKRLVQEADNEA